MSQNNSNQNNIRNRNNNRNNTNKQNGQRNQCNHNREQRDKTVPMHYQIRNLKETDTVELKYTNLDGLVD